MAGNVEIEKLQRYCVFACFWSMDRKLPIFLVRIDLYTGYPPDSAIQALHNVANEKRTSLLILLLKNLPPQCPSLENFSNRALTGLN